MKSINAPSEMLDYLFLNFNNSKISLEVLETFLEDATKYMFPKNTKIFGTAFLKDLFILKDSQQLILKTHLYLEKILNELISKNFYTFNELERFVLNSFYKKVIFLRTQKKLTPELANDFLILNDLRNKYAHKLNFCLVDFDFTRLNLLNKHQKTKILIRGRIKQEFFWRVVFRLYVWVLYDQLHKQYRFLSLMDL